MILFLVILNQIFRYYCTQLTKIVTTDFQSRKKVDKIVLNFRVLKQKTKCYMERIL